MLINKNIFSFFNWNFAHVDGKVTEAVINYIFHVIV